MAGRGVVGSASPRGVLGGLLRSDLGIGRVEAYSDAVLSIIATLLAVPLLKVNEDAKREILVTGGSLLEVLTSRFWVQSFGMCWVAFWAVFVVFLQHGRQFQGLKGASTVLVCANWGMLLATSLLPFNGATAANSGSAADGQGSMKQSFVSGFYLNLVFIALAQVAFNLVALVAHREWFSALFLQESVCTLLLATVAFGLALEVGQGWGLAAFALAPFVHLGFQRRFRAEQLRRRWMARGEEPLLSSDDGEDEAEAEAEAEGAVSAELAELAAREEDAEDAEEAERFVRRLEAFTDGVVAISATLIVLEIKPIPACSQVKDPESCVLLWSQGCRPEFSLEKFAFSCMYDDHQAYEKRNWMLGTYMASFVIINALWLLHHRLLDTIVEVRNAGDLWSKLLHGHFCLFVSMVPFTASLVTEYAVEPFTKHKIDPAHHGPHITPDEEAASTAIVFAGAVLFFASWCLLALLAHHTLKSRPKSRPRAVTVASFCVLPVAAAVTVAICASGANRWALLPILAISPLAALLRWAIP